MFRPLARRCLSENIRTPAPPIRFPKISYRMPQARPLSFTPNLGKQSEKNNDSTLRPPPFEKKRTARSGPAKNALRRAVVREETSGEQTKLCTAYCTAEKYDLSYAATILREAGYHLDPTSTGLTDQVIHLPLQHEGPGDVFIFPTGNIVSWSLPTSHISSLASLLTPAAENPYTKDVETEDLEYVEDPRIRKSWVGGDVIILGTAPTTPNQLIGDNDLPLPPPATADSDLNLTLAKIAFSSGLARSTKLAVLESLLDDYLTTTSSIPTLLSKGSRLPFTRSFILRKTGELLQFRAQLNLYSELTDSLPDIFWDSRHELGLEGYYGAVGRALDVDVRIRQLNEKLDYASGIVEVLRERLSERHALGLEWMIIVLIAVEVGFEIMRMWREAGKSEEEEYRRFKERRERERDVEWQEWKEKMREVGGVGP